MHSFTHWPLPQISRQHPTDQGDRVLPWFSLGVGAMKPRHQGKRTGTGLRDGWGAFPG